MVNVALGLDENCVFVCQIIRACAALYLCLIADGCKRDHASKQLVS